MTDLQQIVEQEIPLEVVSLGLAGHRVEAISGELLSPGLSPGLIPPHRLQELEVVGRVLGLLLQTLQLQQSSERSQASRQLQAEFSQSRVVNDFLQEGGEPLRDPGLAPVQRADHDAEPGVADLVGDLDEVAPVVSGQQAGGEEEEVRGGEAETAEAPVNQHHVQPGQGKFAQQVLSCGEAGGEISSDGLHCPLYHGLGSHKPHCRVWTVNVPAAPAAHSDGEGRHRESEGGVVVVVISQTSSILHLGLSLASAVNMESSLAAFF